MNWSHEYMCRFAGMGNEKVSWKWGALTYNGRWNINTHIRRGKWKTFTVPAISQSLVQESFREWWGCGLQGAYGQRQHTKSLELSPHLQALVTPRIWKAGILLSVCAKKVGEASAAVQGSQLCDLSAWFPSANLTVLSTGRRFFQVHCRVGILCRKYHNATSH